MKRSVGDERILGVLYWFCDFHWGICESWQIFIAGEFMNAGWVRSGKIESVEGTVFGNEVKGAFAIQRMKVDIRVKAHRALLIALNY